MGLEGDSSWGISSSQRMKEPIPMNSPKEAPDCMAILPTVRKYPWPPWPYLSWKKISYNTWIIGYLKTAIVPKRTPIQAPTVPPIIAPIWKRFQQSFILSRVSEYMQKIDLSLPWNYAKGILCSQSDELQALTNQRWAVPIRPFCLLNANNFHQIGKRVPRLRVEPQCYPPY